jgi:His-Xaa-Ser system protein HxsD
MSSLDDANGDHTREISLTFDQAAVDLDALQRSAYALAAQMTIDIRVVGADFICALFPRTPDDEGEIAHRFRMEVNDQVLRARIAEKTEPLRNLIFALAFSRTGLADGMDGEASDAHEVPGGEVVQ